MKKLVVATGNPGKLQEMQNYLGESGWELTMKPPELDIVETGTTFGENARIKATMVAQILDEWAIADDSGLAVTALNGAPGIYSARYAATDELRISKLLQQMQGQDNREAQFICAVAIAKPDGSIALETEGVCKGEISLSPRGGYGFGYDPIFYVPEYGQTFGEMSRELKQKISHRGKAFGQLLSLLPHLD